MTFAFIGSLMLQVSALALVYRQTRGRWLSSFGAMFIALAVVFHGLGEILVRAFPGENPWRPYVSPRQVDDAILILSMAMALMAVCYLAALGRPRCAVSIDELERRRRAIAGFFDWRVTLLACAPVVALALSGRGATTDVYAASERSSTLSSFVALYIMLALGLTGCSLLTRFGKRVLLPVAVLEALILAAAGGRSQVGVGVLVLLVAASHFGIRLSSKQLGVGLALVLGVAWVLTSARAQVGREPFGSDQGLDERVLAVTAGVGGLTSEVTTAAVRETLGHRLDGNSFAAQEMGALAEGGSPLGLTPIFNDVRLAVPSALNPAKTLGDPADRVQKLYAQRHLGLPERDILATQLGVTMGYFGWPGVFGFAALFGVAFGKLDRGLDMTRTPARFVAGLGVLYATLSYWGSFEVWTIGARGTLSLLVVVVSLRTIRHLVRPAQISRTPLSIGRSC